MFFSPFPAEWSCRSRPDLLIVASITSLTICDEVLVLEIQIRAGLSTPEASLLLFLSRRWRLASVWRLASPLVAWSVCHPVVLAVGRWAGGCLL